MCVMSRRKRTHAFGQTLCLLLCVMVCLLPCQVGSQFARGVLPSRAQLPISIIPRPAETAFITAAMMNDTLSFRLAMLWPPPQPTGVKTTVYFASAEDVPLETVATRCALVCALHNVATGMPSLAPGTRRCVAIQVELPACHSLTAPWRAQEDASDPSYAWCTLLDTLATPGTRVPAGTLCVGQVNPQGTGCNSVTTAMVPTLGQALFFRAAFGMSVPGACAPVLPRTFAQAILQDFFLAGQGAVGTAVGPAAPTLVDLAPRYGFLSAASVLQTVDCLGRHGGDGPLLVPGQCLCFHNVGATYPNCTVVLSGCYGASILGAPASTLSLWRTNGLVPQAASTAPQPTSYLLDASFTTQVPVASCTAGGCVSPSAEGPLCDKSTCNPGTPQGWAPARCGGPGIGHCTTDMPGGCECEPGTYRDPTKGCGTCLDTNAVPGSDLGSIAGSTDTCAFLAAPCFEHATSHADPWRPILPCSGLGQCYRPPSSRQLPYQCICTSGWAGPGCSQQVPQGSCGILAAAHGSGPQLEASAGVCGRTPTRSNSSTDATCGVVLVHFVLTGSSLPQDAEKTCVARAGRVATATLVASNPVLVTYLAWFYSSVISRSEATRRLVTDEVVANRTQGPIGVVCQVPHCAMSPHRLLAQGMRTLPLPYSTLLGVGVPTLGWLLAPTNPTSVAVAWVDAACTAKPMTGPEFTPGARQPVEDLTDLVGQILNAWLWVRSGAGLLPPQPLNATHTLAALGLTTSDLAGPGSVYLTGITGTYPGRRSVGKLTFDAGRGSLSVAAAAPFDDGGTPVSKVATLVVVCQVTDVEFDDAVATIVDGGDATLSITRVN